MVLADASVEAAEISEASELGSGGVVVVDSNLRTGARTLSRDALLLERPSISRSDLGRIGALIDAIVEAIGSV